MRRARPPHPKRQRCQRGAHLLTLWLVSVGPFAYSAAEPDGPVTTRAPQHAEVPLAQSTLDKWRFYSEAVIPARPGTYIAGCRGSFSAMLRALDAAGVFDPNSVRVAEALPGGRTGPELPSSFVQDEGFDARKNASGVVLWQVSPSTYTGWQRRFRVYFDTVENGPKPLARSPLRQRHPTLVVNGDFEDGTGRRLPGGWELKRRWGCERVEAQLSAPTHAVRLRPRQAGWAAALRTPGRPGTAVEPGKRYVLSFRYVLDHAHARGLHVAAYWFDTSESPLRDELILAVTEPSEGWKTYRKELSPPQGAGYLSVQFSTQSREGNVLVDDIAIAPLSLPTLDGAFAVPQPLAEPDVDDDAAE